MAGEVVKRWVGDGPGGGKSGTTGGFLANLVQIHLVEVKEGKSRQDHRRRRDLGDIPSNLRTPSQIKIRYFEKFTQMLSKGSQERVYSKVFHLKSMQH